MSLDVYLENAKSRGPGTGIFVRRDGGAREITREEWDECFPDLEPVTVNADDAVDECFSLNITHNLTAMANAAGIYKHLWRPEEIGITKASQLVKPLLAGLKRLRAEPETYKAFNPSNGWGSYEGLVRFVEEYLEACRCNPDATVRASR